jgi:hypothetical protein
MKHLLGAGLIAALSCSVAQAQISYTNTLAGATLIYSNGFDGATVNITNTPPDYATNIYGGTNTALWVLAGGTTDTGGNFYADGTVSDINGDTILLPFKIQTNLVYTMVVTANYNAYPGSWIAAGFAQNYTSNVTADTFNSSGVNGYNWALMQENSANIQYFPGPSTSVATVYNKNGSWTPALGTHTLKLVFDTTSNENSSNRWSIAGFIDGVQLSNNFTYSANPAIGAVGLGQHALGAPANYQWKSFALYATPLAIIKAPASATVNAGAAFTNTVIVGGTAPFSYQWYNNGVPLTNGGSISGATNASLVINPVSVTNISTNYSVVVTNSAFSGAVTSTWSLAVNAAPAYSSQTPTTNAFAVYAGSSPRFSVATTGKQPITYQWSSNSVALTGQTASTFTLTNVQTGPITVFCVASNSVGTLTSMTWTVSITADPTASNPTNLLAQKPIGYWPLNEAEVGSGDDGVVAIDYVGGNNGAYTNVILGNSGYSGSDPSAASPIFGSFASTDCGAFGIQGINFAAPNGTSTTFTVQAWVAGFGGSANGAGIVSLGNAGNEQFALDLANNDYEFAVRDASGGFYSAKATFGPDAAWHYLVGVCDEVNGAVSLYVDGQLAASTPIASGSGSLSSTNAMAIGAKSSTATNDYSLQFKGYLDEVAVFNYALSYAQVDSLYESFGNSVPAYLVSPLPPTNIVYSANATITIPATVSGQPTVGYTWTDVNTSTVLGSGATTNLTYLNATLSIPNASTNLSGDQLELTVTNASGTANWYVTLFSPPPPVQLPYTNEVLYSNLFDGGTMSVSGQVPTVVNSLVGGTNTVWTCTFTNNNNSINGTVLANGMLGTNEGCSLLPFTPEPGYVYTMTASLSATAAMGNWVAMGFAQGDTPTSNGTAARFTEAPYNGYAWMYVQNSSAVFEQGPRTSGSANSFSPVPLPSALNPVTMQIVLDTTTNNAWTASAFLNGFQVGTNVVYTSPLPIAYAGLCQNTFFNSVNGTTGIQWNYWELTQEGSNVPPYLLAPVPPTSVTVAAGSTLTIPA